MSELEEVHRGPLTRSMASRYANTTTTIATVTSTTGSDTRSSTLGAHHVSPAGYRDTAGVSNMAGDRHDIMHRSQRKGVYTPERSPMHASGFGDTLSSPTSKDFLLRSQYEFRPVSETALKVEQPSQSNLVTTSDLGSVLLFMEKTQREEERVRQDEREEQERARQEKERVRREDRAEVWSTGGHVTLCVIPERQGYLWTSLWRVLEWNVYDCWTGSKLTSQCWTGTGYVTADMCSKAWM